MTGSQNIVKTTIKTLTANGLTILLRRYGKVCTATCNSGQLTRNIPSGDAIAIFPTDFRPNGWLPFVDQATGTTGMLTSGVYYALNSTYGNLTSNKALEKGTYVRFTVTYYAID